MFVVHRIHKQKEYCLDSATPNCAKPSKRSPLSTPTMTSSRKHIEPDEDDTPMSDAPPEPDAPPAPAFARPMSNFERCIALCMVYGAGPS